LTAAESPNIIPAKLLTGIPSGRAPSDDDRKEAGDMDLELEVLDAIEAPEDSIGTGKGIAIAVGAFVVGVAVGAGIAALIT
jgi:hypothetical protein